MHLHLVIHGSKISTLFCDLLRDATEHKRKLISKMWRTEKWKWKSCFSNEMSVFEKYWEIGILCRNRSHRTFCIQFSIVLSSIYLDSFLKHNPFWTIALAVSILYAADCSCMYSCVDFIDRENVLQKQALQWFQPKMLNGRNFTQKFISSAFIDRSFWHTEINEGKQLLNHAISWDLLSSQNVCRCESSSSSY